MPSYPGGERYRLELGAMPGDVPAVVRLRHVLKSLLRTYRLRCLSVVAAEAGSLRGRNATVPEL